MPTPHALQLSLYRHQARLIEQAVGGTSPAFERYEAEYRRHSARAQRVVTRHAVEAAASQADIVHVGDYHTLKRAQTTYLELVQQLMATGRTVVLALECFDIAHQRQLDRACQRRLSVDQLAKRCGYGAPGDLWPQFAPIVTFALEHGLKLVAIDSRAGGKRSLQRRDRLAAQRIVAAHRQPDRPVVAVLIGQYHVAPPHLPQQVARLAPGASQVVVYQNAETLYWAQARRGRLDQVEAVQVKRNVFCLLHTAPTLAQRSFLDYVERQPTVEPESLSQTFGHLVRRIARQARVTVPRLKWPVEILSPSTPEGLARSRLAPEVTSSMVQSESAWLPSVPAVWIRSSSVGLLAGEAARVVRHQATGGPAEPPTSGPSAFWRFVAEEAVTRALAWSVEPPVSPPRLSVWVHTFRRGQSGPRRVAAFVLALLANLDADPAALRPLLPLRDRLLCRDVADGLARFVARGLLAHGAPSRLPTLLTFDPVDAEGHIPRWCSEALRPPNAPTASRFKDISRKR